MTDNIVTGCSITELLVDMLLTGDDPVLVSVELLKIIPLIPQSIEWQYTLYLP